MHHLTYFTILAIILDFQLSNADLQFFYHTEKSENKDTIFEGETLTVIFVTNRNKNVECKPTYKSIVTVSKQESGNLSETVFTVKGLRLGEEWLQCEEERNPSQLPTRVPVVVIRDQDFIDKIFPFYVTAIVLLLNVVFGTEVSLKDIKFILLRPKPLVVAAVCQFVLLPPFGLVLARVFDYEPDVALGLVMVACAPGGGNSNTASFLVGGEVPLSISMTFFSTAIAIGTMPLNLWIYGRFASSDPNFTAETIPYFQMTRTLILIVIPVAVGMLLISKAYKVTSRVMRFAKPFVFVLFLTFICIAIYRSRFVFQITPLKGYLGAVLLPIGGFLIGGVAAWFLGLRASQVKTIALEVGMQNAGIVISMTLVVFSQPKADLNSIMPICIALLTAAVATPLYIIHYLVYKFNKRYRQVCDQNKEAQLMEREMFEKTLIKEDVDPDHDRTIEEGSSNGESSVTSSKDMEKCQQSNEL